MLVDVHPVDTVSGGDVLNRVVGTRLHLDAFARFASPRPGEVQPGDQRVMHPIQIQRGPWNRRQLNVPGNKRRPVDPLQPQTIRTTRQVVVYQFERRVVTDPQGIIAGARKVVVQVLVALPVIAVTAFDGRIAGTGQIVVLNRIVAGTPGIMLVDVHPVDTVSGGDVLNRVVGTRLHLDAFARFARTRPRQVQIRDEVPASTR